MSREGQNTRHGRASVGFTRLSLKNVADSTIQLHYKFVFYGRIHRRFWIGVRTIFRRIERLMYEISRGDVSKARAVQVIAVNQFYQLP